MNQQTISRSNGIFKRALALICMMLSIASFFSCINIEPMLASAYTTYTYQYTLSGARVDGGSAISYSDGKAVKYECSASWITVNQSYASGRYSFRIYVNVNNNKALSAQSKRYGYVKLKDKSGKILRQYQIIQEQPYVRVYGISGYYMNARKGSSMSFKMDYNCPFSVWVNSPWAGYYTIRNTNSNAVISVGGSDAPYGTYRTVKLSVFSKENNTNDRRVDISAGRRYYNTTASSSVTFYHNSAAPEPYTYVCQKNGKTYTFQTYDDPKEGLFTFKMVGTNFPEFTGAKSYTYTMNFHKEDVSGGAYIYHSNTLNTGYDNEELVEDGWNLTDIGEAYMRSNGELIDIVVEGRLFGLTTYSFYRQ